MSIVSPIGFVRNAVKAQLADAVKGLNPNIATYAAVYGATAWTFDFTGASGNFFEANVDYTQSEETDIAQTNLLALYGGPCEPFPDDKRVFNAAFSGTVYITVDMYIGALGEKIQKFEALVDTATAAMTATMNNVNNQIALNSGDSTRNGKAYAMDLAAKPQKAQFDGENWIIPVRFTMSFGALIP
jgi:hypothetical protein